MRRFSTGIARVACPYSRVGLRWNTSVGRMLQAAICFPPTPSNPRPVNMNETEEQVVEILTSCPRTNVPWTEPMSAVAKKMEWSTEKTLAFVEYLMYRKIVVLKTEGLHRAAEQENRGQFWWERGKPVEGAR